MIFILIPISERFTTIILLVAALGALRSWWSWSVCLAREPCFYHTLL